MCQRQGGGRLANRTASTAPTQPQPQPCGSRQNRNRQPQAVANPGWTEWPRWRSADAQSTTSRSAPPGQLSVQWQAGQRDANERVSGHAAPTVDDAAAVAALRCWPICRRLTDAQIGMQKRDAHLSPSGRRAVTGSGLLLCSSSSFFFFASRRLHLWHWCRMVTHATLVPVVAVPMSCTQARQRRRIRFGSVRHQSVRHQDRDIRGLAAFACLRRSIPQRRHGSPLPAPSRPRPSVRTLRRQSAMTTTSSAAEPLTTVNSARPLLLRHRIELN